MSESVSVEVEELSATERNLKISVAEPEVSKALEKAVTVIQKKSHIKGFRKGKAPLQMVKRLYAGEIESEAVYRLLDTSYLQALQNIELRIVSQPVIQDLNFSEGKNFSYVAKVEILPEIKLQRYKGLEIEALLDDVKQDQVERELEHLRDSKAELTPIDPVRPIQNGDFVIVDVLGTVEEKHIPELCGDNLDLEVGKGLAFPGFEEKVLGAMPGEERDFELTYPADKEHELAGKTVHFHVKFRELKAKNLPELNDDFARDCGEFSSLEDLRLKIRQELETRAKDNAINFGNNQVIEKLIEANTIGVPNAMVEEEAKAMLQELRNNFAQRGMKLADDDPDLQDIKADYHKRAEKRVQAGLLLDSVAKKEGLQVSDADVEQSLQKLSDRVGRPIEEVRRYYKEEKSLESLRLKILEEKTLEFLRENAKIIKKIDGSEPPKA